MLDFAFRKNILLLEKTYCFQKKYTQTQNKISPANSDCLGMNQDHLENLAKGKDFWNKWRKDNADINPDLRTARLTNMDSHLIFPLKRRNLRGYDLTKVNFWQANLRAVDLSEANLSEAYLNQANLEEADLTGANLQNACIEKANLSKALFPRANLSSAQLWGSNLSRADCRVNASN